MGQKVVCVKEFEMVNDRTPVVNKIYTITSIRYGVEPQNKKEIFLTFDEVGIYIGGIKSGYSYKYFKPLDEIRGEMFSKLLNNKKVHENV
jgi:hypothetical protein